MVLKQLTADYPDASTLSRFCSVTRWANKFNHPNITKTSTGWAYAAMSDQMELTSGNAQAGKPTIVLEDQQGMDLFVTSSSARGPHAAGGVLQIAVQLADALSVVHYQQVIHKDLHPGNILFNPATGLARRSPTLASRFTLSREQPAPATAGAHRRCWLTSPRADRPHEPGAGLPFRFLHPGLHLFLPPAGWSPAV